MIEVEKKFILNKEDEQRLTSEADFISEKVFTDIYYEDAELSLTTSDRWLRERSGKFELKLPFSNEHNVDEHFINQYNELDTDQEIYLALGIHKKSDLAQDLFVNGYLPCATLTTTRKKYRRGDFTIDLDSTDFGYTISEIEKLVADETNVTLAIDDILKFATLNGLAISPVRGKLIEYLRLNKPKHFDALVSANIVKQEQLV